jgi:hypothetical protein
MSLESICMQFDLPCNEFKIDPLGKGLINDTYVVQPVDSKYKTRYVLQRINKTVFWEPDKVMHNLIRINKHLEQKPSEYQELIKSKEGKPYHIDANDDYWRTTKYLENTKTLYKASSPDIAYEAAKTYGTFLGDLRDLPVSEVYETIPEFHNYANRISQLKEAIRGNSHDRLKICQKEINTILQRTKYIDAFYALELPISVIHSDTKLTNILFDARTLKGRMVIDLDIAMPGSILFDYGDMIRSFTNTLEEDDPDLKSIDVDQIVFEQITRGFLESAISFIQKKELDNLLLGAKVVILVQAIRNLADFLNGDIYYKIDYENHNLHRAQNQLTLLGTIEYHEENLQSIVRRYI